MAETVNMDELTESVIVKIPCAEMGMVVTVHRIESVCVCSIFSMMVLHINLFCISNIMTLLFVILQILRY